MITNWHILKQNPQMLSLESLEFNSTTRNDSAKFDNRSEGMLRNHRTILQTKMKVDKCFIWLSLWFTSRSLTVTFNDVSLFPKKIIALKALGQSCLQVHKILPMTLTTTLNFARVYGMPYPISSQSLTVIILGATLGKMKTYLFVICPWP